MAHDPGEESPWLDPEQAPPPTRRAVGGRTRAIGQGLRWSSGWALRLLLLGVAVFLVLELVGRLWVGILPVVISLLVASLLWPVRQLLRSWHLPASLAALVALLLGLGVIAGIAAVAVPQIVDQAPRIASSASQGVRQVQEWLRDPPFNLGDQQITEALDAVQQRIRDSGEAIASGAFSTVTALGSFLVGVFLVLVLTFFMLKDGDRFLPWLRRWSGPDAGDHLGAALGRVWHTLSGYLRAQALVSLVDAVGIGVGLALLGVPLATPLALITFVAGFVPIVGAIAAGVLAVLVALVTTGPTEALLVIALVLLVQQLEGNVLSPLLQGKAMELHPAVILLAVTAGGSWFGIVGAFLAVPAVASLVTVLRYLNEQADQRSEEERGEEDPPEGHEQPLEAHPAVTGAPRPD